MMSATCIVSASVCASAYSINALSHYSFLHSRDMDPREFLRLLLKRDRTNPTALARTLKTLGRTNVNLQSHISRWLGDPSHSLAITTAEPIAEHLEIDLAALYKPAVARAEAIRLGLVEGHEPDAAPQVATATAGPPPISDDEDRVVRVPMLAATASMGPGADQHDEDVITGTLSVSADWAARELHLPASRLKGLRFITGYGDSMRPTFASGDVLLVDTAVHEANVDGIYVLSSAQQLFIKRVTRRLDGVHEISSDNPAVRQTSVLNGDHRVDVLGRVVYVWNGRKV